MQYNKGPPTSTSTSYQLTWRAVGSEAIQSAQVVDERSGADVAVDGQQRPHRFDVLQHVQVAGALRVHRHLAADGAVARVENRLIRAVRIVAAFAEMEIVSG